MKAEKISIESPFFQQMKTSFDSKLNGLINKMLAKGVDDGKLTLALEVHTEPGEAPDPDIDPRAGMTKETIIPMFKFKITDAITVKTDHSGTVGDTDHELIKDRESDGWLIARVNDAQVSLWDEEDEPDEDEG